MSIISSALRAVGTALKFTAKMIGKAAVGTAKSFGGAVKNMGRAAVGSVRLAGRAVVATARLGYRVAYVGAGLAANAAHNLINMFGRGGGQELQEPAQEVFSPTEEWVESMEAAHLEHELAEVADMIDEQPNAEAYKYLVSDDRTRRSMSLNNVDPYVRSWCHSLVQSERQLVRRAGAQGMLRHIAGGKQIAGVRKVKPRESVLDFSQRGSESAFEMDDSFGPGTEMRLAM